MQEDIEKRSAGVLAAKVLTQMNDAQIICNFVTEGEVLIGFVDIDGRLLTGVA
jgi:hypothetical protein